MKRKKRGLLICADDLAANTICTIHDGDEMYKFLLGDAMRIKAINLPFVVVKLLSRSDAPPITLDVRMCNLMPVTEDFVAAQASEQTPRVSLIVPA